MLKIKVLTCEEGKAANAKYRARVEAAESAFERIWRREIEVWKAGKNIRGISPMRHSPGEYKKRKSAYMEAARIRWILEDRGI